MAEITLSARYALSIFLFSLFGFMWSAQELPGLYFVVLKRPVVAKDKLHLLHMLGIYSNFKLSPNNSSIFAVKKEHLPRLKVFHLLEHKTHYKKFNWAQALSKRQVYLDFSTTQFVSTDHLLIADTWVGRNNSTMSLEIAGFPAIAGVWRIIKIINRRVAIPHESSWHWVIEPQQNFSGAKIFFHKEK